MTQLDIRQLADNGGTDPIAPITVPEAVVFSDGDNLKDVIGTTDISNIGNGSVTGAISNIQNSKANYETDVWTPHIYDYETYVTSLPEQPYYKIGDIWFLPIGANMDAVINTMLQIRNFPCYRILGGNVYMAAYSGQGGTVTVQASSVGVYFRPNVTGTFSSSNYFSAFLVGYGDKQ